MEWINTNYKLPEDGQWVLAVFTEVFTAQPYTILVFEAGADVWRDESGSDNYRTPDYWLPLSVLPALPVKV